MSDKKIKGYKVNREKNISRSIQKGLNDYSFQTSLGEPIEFAIPKNLSDLKERFKRNQRIDQTLKQSGMIDNN